MINKQKAILTRALNEYYENVLSGSYQQDVLPDGSVVIPEDIEATIFALSFILTALEHLDKLQSN